MVNSPTPSLKQFLIHLAKPYKGLFAIIALVGVLWAFINTFLPYTLKLIIDHVVGYEGDRSNLFQTTQPYVFGYIALWIGLCANMRLLDWVKLKLFPNLREDVITQMFAYLNQHSNRYFQNNFAGSLINKITDMQNGVINIFTNIDDIFAQTLGMTIAAITLLFIHPIFAVILIGWSFTFILVTFIFLKPI